MQTTTITIPSDKAEALRKLSELSTKSLQLLSDKLKNADAKRLADIEKKIESFHFMI